MVKEKVCIDSNLVSRVYFPNKNNQLDRQLSKLVLGRFEISHNIISLVESTRNYRILEFKRQKLHQLIGGNPEIPNNKDWHTSHTLLMQWASLKKERN